jgi:AraC family transcriptional regulator
VSGILGAQQGSFGRVTLFDIRDPVADHAHPHVHLLFKVEGSDRGVEIAGQSVTLSNDNCLMISPWQRHADIPEQCTSPTTMLALYIEPAFLEARYGSLPHPVFLAASDELSRAGHGLVGEISDLIAGHGGQTNRLEGAILALVDEAMRRESAEQRSTISDYRIRRAMARLREHPHLHPDFVSIASSVGLSRSRFFEQFKHSLGIAPAMYVDGLLLEAAIALLVLSDRSIEEISNELGFAAQSSFSRFVKDRVGFPPVVLRHAHRAH